MTAIMLDAFPKLSPLILSAFLLPNVIPSTDKKSISTTLSTVPGAYWSFITCWGMIVSVRCYLPDLETNACWFKHEGNILNDITIVESSCEQSKKLDLAFSQREMVSRITPLKLTLWRHTSTLLTYNTSPCVSGTNNAGYPVCGWKHYYWKLDGAVPPLLLSQNRRDSAYMSSALM